LEEKLFKNKDLREALEVKDEKRQPLRTQRLWGSTPGDALATEPTLV
jgi:hypothetical protein